MITVALLLIAAMVAVYLLRPTGSPTGSPARVDIAQAGVGPSHLVLDNEAYDHAPGDLGLAPDICNATSVHGDDSMYDAMLSTHMMNDIIYAGRLERVGVLTTPTRSSARPRFCESTETFYEQTATPAPVYGCRPCGRFLDSRTRVGPEPLRLISANGVTYRM